MDIKYVKRQDWPLSDHFLKPGLAMLPWELEAFPCGRSCLARSLGRGRPGSGVGRGTGVLLLAIGVQHVVRTRSQFLDDVHRGAESFEGFND